MDPNTPGRPTGGSESVLRDEGAALLRSGDFAGAVDLLTQAVEADSRDETAWRLLGGALASQRDYPRAISAFDRAAALAPGNARNHYNLALAYQATNRSNDALAALDRALAVDPAYEAARTLRAQLGGAPLPPAAPAVAPGGYAPPAPQRLAPPTLGGIGGPPPPPPAAATGQPYAPATTPGPGLAGIGGGVPGLGAIGGGAASGVPGLGAIGGGGAPAAPATGQPYAPATSGGTPSGPGLSSVGGFRPPAPAATGTGQPYAPATSGGATTGPGLSSVGNSGAILNAPPSSPAPQPGAYAPPTYSQPGVYTPGQPSGYTPPVPVMGYNGRSSDENTSGMQSGVPVQIAGGWNWGASFITFWWLIYHKKPWWAVAYFFGNLIPFVGYVLPLIAFVYMGLKGNEIGWQNRRFASVEDFQECQSIWAKWVLGLFIVQVVLGGIVGVLAVVGAITIPHR